MARHDVILFVSADAVPEDGWLDAMRRAIARADVAYGRQRHAPPRHNATTVSRGLRYHHFEREAPEALPETYASNVNAAYRRFAFQTLKFDGELSGSEDVAFAKMARLAGLRIAYARDAVVRHKDVASMQGEWRKHTREGAAQAQLRHLLGTPRGHLAWIAGVAGCAAAAAFLANAWLVGAAVVLLFAPTLRRLLSPGARRYRTPQLAAAAALSPVFDLAFIGSYLTRRVRQRG
jgi:GT2 family glycosyltransferase